MKKNVTLRDLAKLAGVSIGTVSRYFSDPQQVKKVTRVKIEEANKVLNYSPNLIAQSLATGVSNNLLLCIVQEHPIISSTWLHELPAIQGIYDYLSNTRYNLSVAIKWKEDIDNQNFLYDELKSRKFDGIIILSAWKINVRTIIDLIDMKYPYILLSSENSVQPTNDILFDNTGVVRELVSRLHGLGHTKIAMITGDREQEHMKDRIKGYQLEMENLDLKPYAYIQYGKFGFDSGYRNMQALMEVYRDVTAVICGNDYIAAGAMRAIKEKGMKVPDDISVTGFDNSEFAHIIEPALTTVKLPVFKLSQIAIGKLCKLIQNKEFEAGREILPGEIVEGESICDVH